VVRQSSATKSHDRPLRGTARHFLESGFAKSGEEAGVGERVRYLSGCAIMRITFHDLASVLASVCDGGAQELLGQAASSV
jgi:hypothetical protein